MEIWPYLSYLLGVVHDLGDSCRIGIVWVPPRLYFKFLFFCVRASGCVISPCFTAYFNFFFLLDFMVNNSGCLSDSFADTCVHEWWELAFIWFKHDELAFIPALGYPRAFKFLNFRSCQMIFKCTEMTMNFNFSIRQLTFQFNNLSVESWIFKL